MGNLAFFLQQMFQTSCPDGWSAKSEVQVLANDLRGMLGYSPQVDILLERNDGSKRLWIEFEISRADPVANHAKFATAQLFQPQTSEDVFVSMMSPHIHNGKRNLGANTIWVMRHLGMKAYQTTLFPYVEPNEVKRINHLDLNALFEEKLNVEREIQRAIEISEPLKKSSSVNIHFVANNMEALLNLHQWNQDILTGEDKAIWKKRTTTYFIYDRRSGLFAPSKYCAYIAEPNVHQRQFSISDVTMTIQSYVQIEQDHAIFDGQRARKHLCGNLAMTELSAEYASDKILRQFNKWLNLHQDSINVHPVGATFIIPPSWA